MKTSAEKTAYIAATVAFALCCILWILPTEADVVFSISVSSPFVYALLVHLVVTGMIALPVAFALWRGVTIRQLLRFKRMLVVVFFAVIWNVFFSVTMVMSIQRGTFFSPPQRSSPSRF